MAPVVGPSPGVVFTAAVTVHVADVAPEAITIGEAQVVAAIKPPTIGTDESVTDKPPDGAALDDVTVTVETLEAASTSAVGVAETETDGTAAGVALRTPVPLAKL
jgi:hypothetical protein